MSIENSQIVPAFRKSGMTQEKFCVEHGISIHKMRYYLYKQKERVVKSMPPEKHSKSAVSQPSPSFISFDHHTDDRNVKKHAFTILSVQLTIDEIVQLLRTMDSVSC